jgi:hypothetical protein
MKRSTHYLLVSILLVCCKNDIKTPGTESAKTNTPEKIIAVCISNGIPIREEPNKDSKWVSSMNLGETALYLGETVVDRADKSREFYKLELSDGTVQWARSNGIILNAQPAAVLVEAPIYVRPELVTKTDKSFNPAEFLVIVNEKDEWVEAVGTEKRKKGWIKKEVLSTKDEDIAIATLANKEIIDENGDILLSKVTGFLEDLPNPDASLAVHLQQLIDEQVESAIEKSIMEYEKQSVVEEETEEI